LGSLIEDSISDATDDNLASVEIDAGDGESTVHSADAQA
jgi:hypothetical protein